MSTVLNSPAKAGRKAKGDGHLRRAEILAAAEKIFLEDGYGGATIRKIAEAVGVSSTALYMHFPDKDAILFEICEVAIQRMIDFNSQLNEQTIDPVDRVRIMLEAYMTFALDNPNSYILVFCSHGSHLAPDKRRMAEAMGERNYELFYRAVGEIAKAGRLRTGSVAEAAQALWAGCHGLVSLLLIRSNFPFADPANLQTVVLDALLHGLVAD